MTSTTATLQQFDKGLRSLWLPEQLATISTLRQTLMDNPVPVFVNSMLVRLAEAFKDSTNEVRVGIARALSECGSQLTLAFSSAEILRQIMVVSHSNDPDAREATLDVLGSLASIFPENSQAHHAISESLSTTYENEFRAACAATKAFAHLSSAFAESIVPQIGKILEDSTISEVRKIRLCKVFSTMSANAQCMEQIFSIFEVIINQEISDDFLAAFLESTTSLSVEVRYAIPKQIDIILKLLEKAEKHEQSAIKHLIILKELKIVARYSNIWKHEQVQDFCSRLQPNFPKYAIPIFFDIADRLTKNCPIENLIVLREFNSTAAAYGSASHPNIIVRYIQFASNVVCSPKVFESVEPRIVQATMRSLAVMVVAVLSGEKIDTTLAKKLYRSVGDLLCAFPYTEYEFSTMIISSIFSAFESPYNSDKNQKQRLELLCRLVDTDRIYINDIFEWAVDIYRQKPTLFQAYPHLFSYLSLAVGTEIPENFEPVLFESPKNKYELARSAFRNGQWKKVAKPNLDEICVMSLNKESCSWILALRSLAASQLEEFTLEELDVQQNCLRNAASTLNVSKIKSEFENDFRFPIDMIQCMIQTSDVFSHILSVLTPFVTQLSAALTPGQFYNPITAKRFVVALSTVEQPLFEAQCGWSTLGKTCFCADSTSVDLITVYYTKMVLLATSVKILLGKQAIETGVQLPQFGHQRTCYQYQQENLQWVLQKMQNLKGEGDLPNINSIRALFRICEQLAMTPFMLPRFFFQQFYHVDFKLSITPSNEKNKGVTVQTSDTVPIRVDGAIISTHSSNIRQVIVIAEINFSSNQQHNFTLSTTAEPNEQNYFTAQFLLNFKFNCEIKFRLEFTDSTYRKQWKSSVSATLPITVRETTKQHHGQQMQHSISTHQRFVTAD